MAIKNKTQSGFGNTFSSEAEAGALPTTQNTPKPAPRGLCAEQLNGTVFTAPPSQNRRSWLYKIRPSLGHSEFRIVETATLCVRAPGDLAIPNLMRWRPLAAPAGSTDFVSGLHLFGGSGDPSVPTGMSIFLFAANTDMKDCCLVDSDGDLLVIPESGTLLCRTELGILNCAPGEILLIPRGIKFAIELPDGHARGYVLEIWGAQFRLPHRGPLGANGLADARHFLAPVAAYEDRKCPGYRLLNKFGGRLFEATQDHSAFDVVAWHGNHTPYKYDLSLFNSMGSVSFDHPDPSILTVLTAVIGDGPQSVADFVLFPGRWDVAEHTFRPPFHHRNAANEFNGIIRLPKPVSGFEQGGYFLTPRFTAHGLAPDAYLRAMAANDKANRLSDSSLWFQFESSAPLMLTDWALHGDNRDEGYAAMFRQEDQPATATADGDSDG